MSPTSYQSLISLDLPPRVSSSAGWPPSTVCNSSAANGLPAAASAAPAAAAGSVPCPLSGSWVSAGVWVVGSASSEVSLAFDVVVSTEEVSFEEVASTVEVTAEVDGAAVSSLSSEPHATRANGVTSASAAADNFIGRGKDKFSPVLVCACCQRLIRSSQESQVFDAKLPIYTSQQTSCALYPNNANFPSPLRNPQSLL